MAKVLMKGNEAQEPQPLRQDVDISWLSHNASK